MTRDIIHWNIHMQCSVLVLTLQNLRTPSPSVKIASFRQIFMSSLMGYEKLLAVKSNQNQKFSGICCP